MFEHGGNLEGMTRGRPRACDSSRWGVPPARLGSSAVMPNGRGGRKQPGSEQGTCTSASGSSDWLRMYRYEKMTRRVLEFRWAVPRILGQPFPLPHCSFARSVGRSMICKRAGGTGKSVTVPTLPNPRRRGNRNEATQQTWLSRQNGFQYSFLSANTCALLSDRSAS